VQFRAQSGVMDLLLTDQAVVTRVISSFGVSRIR
jgi:hypothetical protein